MVVYIDKVLILLSLVSAVKCLHKSDVVPPFSCAGKVATCAGLINNLAVMYNAKNNPSNPEFYFSLSLSASALILLLSSPSSLLCSLFFSYISFSSWIISLAFLFSYFQAVLTLKLFPTSREYGKRLSHETTLMMILRFLKSHLLSLRETECMDIKKTG